MVHVYWPVNPPLCPPFQTSSVAVVETAPPVAQEYYTGGQGWEKKIHSSLWEQIRVKAKVEEQIELTFLL